MYTGEVWQEYAAHQPQLNYAYDLSQVMPVQDLQPLLPPSLPEAGRVLARTGGDGATLIAPIALRGEPVGLLSFEEPEQPREWSEDDLALVEAVREQLNLALENRLLFEQTQQALAQTRALYEIGRQMAEARSMQEVLQAAVDGLARQLRVDRIIAGLLEPIQAPEVIRGVAGWQREGKVQLGELPLAQVPQLYATLREGVSVYIPDLLADPRETVDGALRVLYGQLGLRGLTAVGLRVLGRAYAGLMIQTVEPHDFSENERRFCESVAQQAATALANLALLADSQAQVERRALLNEVQQTASRSLEPTVLMQDVGRLIAERLAMPVLLWGWDERLTHLIAAYSPAGRRIAMEDFSCRPEDIPGMSWAVRTGEPMLVQNLEQKLSTDTMRRLEEALKLQELYVVPLAARGRVQGVLVLGRQPNHPSIDESEVAFLQLAAVNVGIALENARLYQEAQETAEKLQEVDRLKNQFLASMSHELRTPLNSIIGFSRVILKGIDGPLTEMQQTDLQAIYESGNHLLGLINDILDFSKIEAGKMELIFEPTNLKEAIKGVMTTAIALVKDRPIELQQNIPADLPIVVADGRRIRQIVLNLVGNAAKFTEQGFIRVSASYDAKEVVICVEDTGIGIPPDKVGSIFEAFTQVDSSSTRRYGGTGLGLPITKRFVEMHGGRIWVESKVGEGSSFYVALPIEGPAAAASEEESEEELPVVASTSRVILTVDDDEGVITLFRRYLEKQNYQVVGLTSGDRVVQEARRLKPYAITLDILMPGKDGWQILQDLKSEPETRNIPVIVCSISPDVGRGLSMGISDYLVKPIVEQDLLAALARLEHGDEERRVLVVDDNPDDRKLLHRILRDAGYTVYEAPGGAEAIAMIYESPPDVVVLDLMMPEMDGFAVLENLKSNEGTRDIPVIVVTAKELTSSEREELQVQVEALLQKGLFDQEQLLKDVTAALARLEKGH
jgi:signal transduction histidine kinase/CheY-like chemotaxis protein